MANWFIQTIQSISLLNWIVGGIGAIATIIFFVINFLVSKLKVVNLVLLGVVLVSVIILIIFKIKEAKK